KPRWSFMAVAPWLFSPTEPYLRQLEVGRHRFFKYFRLHRYTTAFVLAAVLALLAVVISRAAVWSWLSGLPESTVTLRTLLLVVTVLTVVFLSKAADMSWVPWVIRWPAGIVVNVLIC